MLPGWYRRWRRAGEEGAIAIYAASSWMTPVVLTAAAATLCLALLHSQLSIVTFAIAAGAAGDLRNFRRAIIFTPIAVVFRPTFGRLRKIPLKDIVLARETTVGEGLRGVEICLAAELVLTRGEKLIIPLNMDKGEEALQRLLKIVAT